MPAVKAANVNSHTVFVCPKRLHRKALGVSVPCSSSKVNAGHQEWGSFVLPWLCGTGRALGPPPAASLGAGVQTDLACCLAQCALAEFYELRCYAC